MDPGHLERRGFVERRQEPGQPPREHGLAGAGRATEQEVVPSGGRDLERATRPLLAADVGEIRAGQRSDAVSGRDGLGLELAAEIRDRLGQVPDRHRLDPGERGLWRRLRGADDPGQPPRRFAPSATAKTPATGRTRPSRASSPWTAWRSSSARGI